MAGGSNNRIVIEFVDSTSQGAGGGASGGVSDRLEQAATTLSEVASKMDAALSAQGRAIRNKDPVAEQARKLELLNATQQADLLRKDKKLQVDRERLQKNEDAQRNIIKEKLLADRTILAAKEERAAKDHNRRLELRHLDQENKNRAKYTAMAGALAVGFAAVGKSLGAAVANYSTSNALIRPDLAYSQLVASAGGVGLNLLSGGLITGGMALGTALGGPVGGAVGGVAGGLAAAYTQFAGANALAGYQLLNSGNYFSQMPQYSYGGSYSGLSPSFMQAAMLQPGGNQNMQQMLSAYYGSVGSAGAFQALSQGTGILTAGTGSQMMMPAIISTLPGIIKATGVGQDASKISDLLSTLTEYQRQYGGDTVTNLQNISTLLQSSSVGNLSTAASMAFGSQLMNPALAQQAIGYASAMPTDQFTQNILSKALTGYSMNDLMGMNGTGAQARALSGVQKRFGSSFGPGTAGTLSSGRIMAQFGLGASLYPILRAQPGNLGMLSPDAKAAAFHAAFSFVGGGGTLNPQNMKSMGIVDPQTQRLIEQAQSSEKDYNIMAKSVTIRGMVGNALGALTSTEGSAATFHKLIHEDNS